MDNYKEQLKQHVEKLFKKTQEIIAKRRGEVNRAKHKNFLSYYAKYCQQNKQKSKGKKSYKNDWRDVFNSKPINKGFRDKSKIPIEPTTEQLEQMIEFFERELEKIDAPTTYENMKDWYDMKDWYEKLRFVSMYQQNPIITATQKGSCIIGHKGKSYGSVFIYYQTY